MSELQCATQHARFHIGLHSGSFHISEEGQGVLGAVRRAKTVHQFVEAHHIELRQRLTGLHVFIHAHCRFVVTRLSQLCEVLALFWNLGSAAARMFVFVRLLSTTRLLLLLLLLLLLPTYLKVLHHQ